MRRDSDDRLLIRAIREGWRLPADRLPAVLDRVLKIATDPVSSDRDATAAVRAILMAQRLQLATVEAEMKLEEHEDLKARIRALEGTDGPPVATPGG